MQKILVDRGKLVLEHLVEKGEGLRIAVQRGVGLWAWSYSAASWTAWWFSSSIP